MRNGLLEHAGDVGYKYTLKPNIYANKETTLSPVFQHLQEELLSQLEISKGEPGQQVRAPMSSSPPHSEFGYEAPTSPFNGDSINTRATDLGLKIMNQLDTGNPAADYRG